jgi:HEAT repeat protein/TPR repeat protein
MVLAAALAAGTAGSPAESLERDCERGEAKACTELGSRHYGDGAAADHSAAATFLQRGCDLGDLFACYRLGSLYYEGAGLPKQMDRARTLWRRGCDGGDPWCCANLGGLLLSASTDAPSREEGLALSRRACGAGIIDACSSWGAASLLGRGTAPDRSRGIAILQIACDGGSAVACDQVVALARDGEAIARDPDAYVRVATALCDEGVPTACASLGRRSLRGLGDEARAFHLFERACAAGSPLGCHHQGLALVRGERAQKDPIRGAALLRRACDGAYSPSCATLGVLADLSSDADPPSPQNSSASRRLSDWTRDLRDADWKTRASAAQAIGAFGAAGRPAIPDLADALTDIQSSVRIGAAYALAEIGPLSDRKATQAVLDLLKRALDDKSWSLSPLAVAKFGLPAVPYLMPLVSNAATPSRRNAIVALGSIGPPADAALPLLKTALEDSDEETRLEAAIAVARVSPPDAPALRLSLERGVRKPGDPERAFGAAEVLLSFSPSAIAVQALVRIAQDKDGNRTERLRAFAALGRAGTNARDSRRLLESALLDNELWVRDAAGEALAAVAPDDAPAALARAWKREHRPVPTLDRLWRGWGAPAGLSSKLVADRIRTARSLESLPPQKAIPWLIALLEDQELAPDPRSDEGGTTSPAAIAHEALSQIGARAVEPLIDAVHSGSDTRRLAAVWVLGSIGGSRARQALRDVIGDSQQAAGIRGAAIQALARAGAPEQAAETLAGVLGDESLRPYATVGLATLGDRRAVPTLLESLADTDWDTAATAADLLAKVPDPRSVDALLTLASVRCTGTKTFDFYRPCTSGLKALVATRDPRAIPTLLHGVESLDDTPAQWDVAIALCGFGPSAIAVLEEAAVDERPARRRAAIYVLGACARLNSRDASEVLAARLEQEPEVSIRKRILWALVEYGGSRKRSALVRALADPQTRGEAVQVIQRNAPDPELLGPLIACLPDTEARLVPDLLAAIRAIAHEDVGSDVEAWRGWWEKQRPQLDQDRAFHMRRLRLTGHFSGSTPPESRVYVTTPSKKDLDMVRRSNGGSSCQRDEYGFLTRLEDGNVLLNPFGDVEADGSVLVVDGWQLLEPGKEYALFLQDKGEWRTCRRVLTNGQPFFLVSASMERADLGTLTLAP